MISCLTLPSYPRITLIALSLLLGYSDFVYSQSTELNSLDRQIGKSPESASAHQQRGVARFMSGQFQEAIADFDRVIELVPEQEAHHWQRGIADYYAEQYAKGVEQFELHQAVNPNDVENAIWHFICKAKANALESAQSALIPIKHDSRAPMMEIWRLFAGTETPEDVLQSAQRKGPSGIASRQSMCYAHLYLGLYYEATGQIFLSEQHIDLAANEYSMDNYMGKVAQVHQKLNKHGNIDHP